MQFNYSNLNPPGAPTGKQTSHFIFLPQCSRDLLRQQDGVMSAHCGMGVSCRGPGAQQAGGPSAEACGSYLLCLHHKHRVAAALRLGNNKPCLLHFTSSICWATPKTHTQALRLLSKTDTIPLQMIRRKQRRHRQQP